MQPDSVIVVPFILPWDRSADYQKQTCLELAKRYRVIAYMECDAKFFLKALVKRTHQYPSYKNILFYTPLYIFPFRRFQFVEKVNQILSYLIFAYFFLADKHLLLWIFDPHFYFLPKLRNMCSMYDCVDYHPGFHRGKKFIDIQHMEKILIRGVDYFFVNSYILFALHRKTRKPDGIVPQGFRLEEVRKPNIPREQLSDKPIIGYIGAIDYRLDVPLLQQLIRRNPQWQFVLWGSMKKEYMSGPEEQIQGIDSLLHEQNVITGESNNPHTTVSVMTQFDIGIIPYDDTLSAVQYSYPMKLFEYFYFGKPVISTRIEELKRFPKYVKIGKSVNSWEKHISSLLSRSWPISYQKEQRKLAEQNSWEKKIQAITRKVFYHV